MQSLLCCSDLVLLLSTLFAILPILPSSAFLTCSSSDLIALQAFQSSLSTPLPWHMGTDCCWWLGIRCDAQGRVISLHLPLSNLSGSIPPLLFQLSALTSLNLSHNSLHGDVAPDIANLSSLTTLDLSYNPSLISHSHKPFLLPPNLHHLHLSHCSFHGSIIINGSSLEHIDIRDNFFASVAINNMAHLRSLQTFDASWNLLGRGILQTLCNCTNLRLLNLDHNYLGGLIPSEIGMLRKLEIMRLQKNQITGFIPHELGECLQVREIWLDDNHLTGTIPKDLGKLALLTTLSLTNNRLEGPIPGEIAKCGKLSVLALSGNMFTGEIIISCLPTLQILRKNGNDLDLTVVPTQAVGSFHELRALVEKRSDCVFSQGAWGISIMQSKSQFLRLHHYHRRHLLQNDVAQSNQSHGLQPIVTGVISGIVVFCGLLLIALMVALIWRMKLRQWQCMRHCAPHPSKRPSLRKQHSERSQVYDPSLTSISMREIIKATDEFNPRRVIGDGGFGIVYRATLSDGRTVAVKKLATDGIQGKREFEAEMDTLGRIKHQNLVELLAFCEVGEERALVYDYMKNGSLDAWLHEREDGPKHLVWEKRMKIARGAAKGLAFLHYECDPHVIHRDIKSSNILLDKDFEARITDFGLARHMSPHLSHVSTEAAGTLGYMAPEYHMTLCATKKADVYSFGMLLLEIASGLRPNAMLEKKKFGTLAKWAEHVVACGNENDILDPIFKERPPPHDQVRAFVRIACQCVSRLPDDRPTMKEVFEQLSLLSVDTSECEIDGQWSAEL
ncbi:hypothetical protein GOP47_0027036 [Adiantum capillus-veneris]|nr:hypothetical protein GOP47_0027036 [Adiantum capillus-veneris]